MNRKIIKVLSVFLAAWMLAMPLRSLAAEPVLTGAGTEDDPYIISDVAGLAALAADPAAFDGCYITLHNDIAPGDEATDFIPIGTETEPFRGIFDGNGFSILNIRIAQQTDAGLFGYAEEAVIRNLTIRNASVLCDTAGNAGTAVGRAFNTQIIGVRTEGCTVQAGNAAGGIAGFANGCLIADCRTDASGSVTVSGGNAAGGIVGFAENVTVERCINSASVNGVDAVYCAGIAGVITGTVSHCLNSGQVSGPGNEEPEADGTTGTAGIAGHAGGLITCCGNAGTVTSATGSGGIAAVAADGLTVSFCYNAAALSLQTDGAAVLPLAPGNAVCENCIAVDGSVQPQDLTVRETFEGWNFETVWYEPGDYHGYGYPVPQDCNFHTLRTVTEDPTCTQPGTATTACEDPECTFSVSEETEPPLGHDWIISSRVDATCVQEGVITYICSRCQTEKPEKDVIPAVPDHHTDEDHDKICDKCGAIVDGSLSALLEKVLVNGHYIASPGDDTDMTELIRLILKRDHYCLLGPGDFLVTGLEMPENSTLQGVGPATRIILSPSVQDGAAIRMASYSCVKDLFIVGSKTEITPPGTVGSRHGILFEGQASAGGAVPYHTTVTNVSVTNFTGGGITCRDTGYNTDAGMNVSDCRISKCGAGINVSYYSEYNRFSNVSCTRCYYGCVNNGGNNLFTNCGFNSNTVGLLMDNSRGQSPNSSHGSFTGCTFNHSGDNTGYAIKIYGMTNGQVFTGSQIFFGKILIYASRGIQFLGTNMGNSTGIEIMNSTSVQFSNCTMISKENTPLTVTDSRTVIFRDCYCYDGSEYSDDIANTVPVVPGVPGKTENLQAVTVNKNQAILTWDATPGAEKYIVYYSASANGSYTAYALPSNNSYTMNRSNADKLYYKVRAFVTENGGRIYGPFSDIVVPRNAIPGQVMNLQAEQIADDTAVLTWDAVPGAEDYIIYGAQTEDGNYTVCGTTPDASYTVEMSNTDLRYYKVRALVTVNGADYHGDYSETLSVFPPPPEHQHSFGEETPVIYNGSFYVFSQTCPECGETRYSYYDAIVSFVDDDGKLDAMTHWENIIDATGVKMTAALITGKVTDQTVRRNYADYTGWDTVERLKNKGVEFVCHTHNHINLTKLTVDELHQDFTQAQAILRQHGLRDDILVYPNNAYNDTTLSVIRQYFKAGVCGGAVTNNKIIDPYTVHRINIFDSSVTEEHSFPTGQTVACYTIKTPEKLQSHLNSALNNHAWLIYMCHFYNSPGGYFWFDEDDEQALIDLCRHIQSYSNVKIVTLGEGLDMNLLSGETDENGIPVSHDEHVWDTGRLISGYPGAETDLITYTCVECGITRTETITGEPVEILTADKVIPEWTSSSCTGNVQRPSVTVRNAAGETLEENTDYTVVYSEESIDPGTYTLTVTGTGNYVGSAIKTYTLLPGKVTNLKAKTRTANQAILTWDKIPGAERYMVYCSESENGAYTAYTTTANTAYTMNKSHAETLYYKVRAFITENGGRVYGTFSDPAMPRNLVPAKVSNLQAVTVAVHQANLTWDAVPGAEKYMIYYASGETGAYTAYTTTTNTAYSVDRVHAELLYYKVCAFNTDNGEKIYGQSSDAALPRNIVPGQVKNLRAVTASANQATLTWDAVPGAERYMIYYASSENGTYTAYSTTSSAAYTVNRAKAGSMCYKVRAFITMNGSKIYGPYSDAALPGSIVPAKVENLQAATGNSNQATLTWDKIPGAEKYMIYYATSENGTYTAYGITALTSYTINKTNAGKLYYKIRAFNVIDGARIYGPFSSVVQAK